MPIIELTQNQLRQRASSKWSQFDVDVIAAGLAEMDFRVAPAIQQRLLAQVQHERYGYAPRGESGTMTAVVDAFQRRALTQFDWTVKADHCQLVVDLIQGVMAAVLAFTDPGEGVVLQVPAYPQFFSSITGAGRRVVANPLRDDGDRYSLDFDHLAAVLTADTRLLLFCHPHNPSGRVFTREHLGGLVQLVLSHDIVVISDEIHADLIYGPDRHVPLAKVLPEIADRIVTLYSPTKTFNFPGLRCGVMHFGSPALQQRFMSRVPETVLGTPSVSGMEATLAAWNDSQAWCNDLLDYLLENRNYLIRRLTQEAPALRVYQPEATYLAWIDCSALLPQHRPYEFFLQRARVGLGDGQTFGKDFGHCVRLNFATSREILDAMLDRMVAAVNAQAR